MDATKLMDDAERETALADWGGIEYFEDTFRLLLSATVESLEKDAHLHEAGRAGAELRLRQLLRARLQFIDCRRREPAIAREKISGPLLITGLPRAGTTFLHT